MSLTSPCDDGKCLVAFSFFLISSWEITLCKSCRSFNSFSFSECDFFANVLTFFSSTVQ